MFFVVPTDTVGGLSREIKERKKKTDTPSAREGREDDTPPPHRDFTGRKVCC